MRRFELLWRQPENHDVLHYEQPAICHAYQLHEQMEANPTPAMIIQARLLGRQSFEQIADAGGLMVDTVKWYESIFFNVVDRIDRRDWITTQVLLPAEMRNRVDPRQTQNDDDNEEAKRQAFFTVPQVSLPYLDASLKFFAYFGGPHICDMMITGFQSGKMISSPNDVGLFFDEYFAGTIRRRTCPVSRPVRGQPLQRDGAFYHPLPHHGAGSERGEPGADKVCNRTAHFCLDEWNQVGAWHGRQAAVSGHITRSLR